ncbi:MAG: CPBP family intramembrane metalloprotease [Candidatus Omnitrophica bacterium]|nr:CPBP family intramembrane metalloprotease [Candidatus Omnitrophota bacterium]
MPKIKRQWFFLTVLSFVSIIVWWRFSYPYLEFADFSVDRNLAMAIARDYLRDRQEPPERFKTAVIFSSDGEADRYLQESVGFKGLIRFLRDQDFDLFYWTIRFFREEDKEGYNVSVSSSTGEIIGFQHILDDDAARKSVEREEARRRAVDFLKERFRFDPDQYTVKGDVVTVLDNRSDFGFNWQKKDVRIQWSNDENAGTGKLVIGATISGDEILSFHKNSFSVPDQFNRHLAKSRDIGKILSGVVHLLSLGLFVSAIFFMIVRRNHLAMHTTKRFYFGLMIFSFFLSSLSVFNQWENVLFGYSAIGAFRMYLWHLAIQTLVNALFVSVIIFMPSLAGEALHYEVSRKNSAGALLHYLRSTFLSREMAGAILLGYAVCVVMLGIQAVVIHIGQRYWGVWLGHEWMANFSTAYWPFLAAFTLGFQASFSEELMFRLFGINFFKKILKNTFIAVLLSSLVWGFSHSHYPVFPMWFRGVEVTCLGIFLSWIYLRYGIIPAIVGHYLFDVFWHCAEYLFGVSTPFYLVSSLSVLCLPLALAVIAYVLNRKVEARPLRWHLTVHQRYNLEVLKTFLRQNPQELRDKTPARIREDIAAHGWDVAVVEVALEDLGIPLARE